ncbi:THO complex subunit 2 isoform X1 [Tanacetum coccineum]|uniref:THO complex subunit 2 isoform X1 n=1 Tax=Tanacetum coccineum TaxID=301880 RepID=A0ABQ5EPU4_9ASTR
MSTGSLCTSSYLEALKLLNYNAKLSDFGLTKDGQLMVKAMYLHALWVTMAMQLFVLFKGKLLDEYEILEAMEVPLFIFSTLVDSIGGFSPNNKIRAGGFGPVYKIIEHLCSNLQVAHADMQILMLACKQLQQVSKELDTPDLLYIYVNNFLSRRASSNIDACLSKQLQQVSKELDTPDLLYIYVNNFLSRRASSRFLPRKFSILPGAISRLIEKTISSSYQLVRQPQVQAKGGDSDFMKMESNTSNRSFIDLPKEIFEMLTSVGPYLHRNTLLLVEVGLDGRLHLKEARLNIEEARGTCLLLLLQLIPANPAVGQDIWAVLSLLPYEARYRLYGEWEKDNECNPTVLSAKQMAKDIDERRWPYDSFDHVLEKKLCARIRRNVSCYGRFMPHMFDRFKVIHCLVMLCDVSAVYYFFCLLQPDLLSKWNIYVSASRSQSLSSVSNSLRRPSEVKQSSIDGESTVYDDGSHNLGILQNNCIPCFTSVTSTDVNNNKSQCSSPPSAKKKVTSLLSFKWRENSSNRSIFSPKAVLRRPTSGSQVPCCPIDKKMSDWWSPLEPSTFKVRGHNYLRDKKKENASNHAAFDPIGVTYLKFCPPFFHCEQLGSGVLGPRTGKPGDSVEMLIKSPRSGQKVPISGAGYS